MQQARKVVVVELPEDVLVDAAGGAVVQAGRYRIELPQDYDESQVTAEDVLLDGRLRGAGAAVGPPARTNEPPDVQVRPCGVLARLE